MLALVFSLTESWNFLFQCAQCGKEGAYHCCLGISYCSTVCQHEHWNVAHKRTCVRKKEKHEQRKDLTNWHFISDITLNRLQGSSLLIHLCPQRNWRDFTAIASCEMTDNKFCFKLSYGKLSFLHTTAFILCLISSTPHVLNLPHENVNFWNVKVWLLLKMNAWNFTWVKPIFFSILWLTFYDITFKHR